MNEEKKDTKTLKVGMQHYCPGCSHIIAHRLIGKVIDEMGLRENTIVSAPVGCAVLLYNYFNTDVIECAHGRVPSVLTGIKRMLPNKLVVGYQGDGDLAAIGTNETIHTANRGENITVIFINNAIYGMTGGQMAPTTLPGQKTTTSPKGRGQNFEGGPLRVCEMLSTLDGPAYIERVALNNSENFKKTEEAIKRAFQCQVDKKGYSFIEILSVCYTGWKMSLKDSVAYIDTMAKYFPLGVFKDVRDER